MNKLERAPVAYTFDDFFLAPVYSEIKSRNDPEIRTNVNNFDFETPIVSAPMNTVTEDTMALLMNSIGAVGVVHRYMSINDQVKMSQNIFNSVGTSKCGIYFAVGANGDFIERVYALYNSGVRNFCIDVANGHSIHCVNAVKRIKQEFPDTLIMSGNVCTFEGAYRLAEAGSNSIRVGVGGGAVCITRLVTGHGVPQLSAIEDCARIKQRQYVGMNLDARNDYTTAFEDVAIIADGGIRNSGDIVKSLAIGADAVMVGSILAGTEETPGAYVEEDGKLYKYYHGMASPEARCKWFDKSKIGLPSEGISTKIPYTGKTAKKVIENLCKSVKVGLSYAGASNLAELRLNAKWVRITPAGYIEGTPHGGKK